MTTRKKVLALTLGSVAVTTLVVVSFAVAYMDRAQRQFQQSQLSWELQVQSARVNAAVHEAQQDVLFIAGLPTTSECLHTSSPGNTGAPFDSVATVFSSLLTHKDHYAQVRLLDSSGMERVRVDRSYHQSGPHTGATRTPRERLQSKHEREYFIETIALPPGSLYVSRVTLNREHGLITLPREPMLRIAAPVWIDGSAVGIVVVNLRCDFLLDSIFRAHSSQYTYIVTNSDGDYLYHPDDSKTFGFETGTRHRIQDDYQEFADLCSTHTTPELLAGRGETLIAGRRVPVDTHLENRDLVLGIVANPTAIPIPSGLQLGFGSLLALAFLSLVTVASYFFADQLTRPLAQVAVAADAVSRGERARLPTQRSDEIGAMSRALDRMIESLHDKEASLLSLNQDLEAKNSDLEHFTHLASHDLREPVRRMGMTADLIRGLEAENLSEEGLRYLEFMVDSADRAQGLITGFRSLARLGSGAVAETVCLQEVAESVIAEEYAEIIENKGLEVTVADLPDAFGYPDLLRILFHNLIDNAVAHSVGESATIRIYAQTAQGDMTYVVSNNSDAISEEDCTRVFLPFVSLAPEKRKSGLGLSICQRVVDRHRGRIWMQCRDQRVEVLFQLALHPVKEVENEPTANDPVEVSRGNG